MKARPWDPWKEFAQIQKQADEMFNRFFARFREQASPLRRIAFSPPVDMYEASGELVVRAALPGTIQDDVDVTIEGQELTIRGEREAPADPAPGSFYQQEWRYGVFERTLQLPRSVDREQVRATLSDGVLEVRLKLVGKS